MAPKRKAKYAGAGKGKGFTRKLKGSPKGAGGLKSTKTTKRKGG